VRTTSAIDRASSACCARRQEQLGLHCGVDDPRLPRIRDDADDGGRLFSGRTAGQVARAEPRAEHDRLAHRAAAIEELRRERLVHDRDGRGRIGVGVGERASASAAVTPRRSSAAIQNRRLRRSVSWRSS